MQRRTGIGRFVRQECRKKQAGRRMQAGRCRQVVAETGRLEVAGRQGDASWGRQAGGCVGNQAGRERKLGRGRKAGRGMEAGTQRQIGRGGQASRQI
jgi:hypothetical protein